MPSMLSAKRPSSTALSIYSTYAVTSALLFSLYCSRTHYALSLFLFGLVWNLLLLFCCCCCSFLLFVVFFLIFFLPSLAYGRVSHVTARKKLLSSGLSCCIPSLLWDVSVSLGVGVVVRRYCFLRVPRTMNPESSSCFSSPHLSLSPI